MLLANDLSNIEESRRSLNDVQTQIKSLQRIEKQLKTHLERMRYT